MSVLGMILTIILINVVYVSLFTIRMIFVLKGLRAVASFLSMVEVLVYLIGLQFVLGHLNQPANLIAYCVGWGGGVYLGSKIESWMALGYTTFQIVTNFNKDLPQILREKGIGVTSWIAEGRDGQRTG
jgi:uncharacterized protein YebE (UPF0316 family)